MEIGLRFQRRPSPKTVKMHGICPHNKAEFVAIVNNSSVYQSKLETDNTRIEYKIVFESNKTNNSKKSQAKLKEQIKEIEKTICYWTIRAYY